MRRAVHGRCGVLGRGGGHEQRGAACWGDDKGGPVGWGRVHARVNARLWEPPPPTNRVSRPPHLTHPGGCLWWLCLLSCARLHPAGARCSCMGRGGGGAGQVVIDTLKTRGGGAAQCLSARGRLSAWGGGLSARGAHLLMPCPELCGEGERRGACSLSSSCGVRV